MLHLQTRSDPTTGFCSRLLRKFVEFCPIAVFAYKFLICVSKTRQILNTYTDEKLHKWHKFHRNRARQLPLWGDKGWIFKQSFLCLTVNPEMWTYKCEIWYSLLCQISSQSINQVDPMEQKTLKLPPE